MKFIKGNIFTTTCQTIVNTVNCFGVMGAGLALECKYRYPDMFLHYKNLCDKQQFSIGQLYLYKTDSRWILNFPTKYHWKYETKPEYIERGLQKFVKTYLGKGITSIAFPLLGAHNGGLSKDESIELLSRFLNDIEVEVEIYDYDPAAADDVFPGFRNQLFSLNDSVLAKTMELSEAKIRRLKVLLVDNQIQNIRIVNGESHFG